MRCFSFVSTTIATDVINVNTMENDLLRREEQYRKENEQLELQTKLLLEKVDNVKKIHESLAVPIETLKNATYSTDRRPPTTSDLNLPNSVDEMGPKGMIHFYKAKLKTTQQELDKIQIELKGRIEELKKQQKINKQLSDDKEKWFFQYTAEKTQNCKLEKQIEQLNSKIQIKDNENSALKKENEQLQAEINKIVNDMRIMDDKLNRIGQENEKHKNALKTAKSSEKEIQENHRRAVNELTHNLQTTQKHKNELLKYLKKQIQLTDNLKKQKTLLESCKAAEIAEIEFVKLLDWKNK